MAATAKVKTTPFTDPDTGQASFVPVADIKEGLKLLATKKGVIASGEVPLHHVPDLEEAQSREDAYTAVLNHEGQKYYIVEMDDDEADAFKARDAEFGELFSDINSALISKGAELENTSKSLKPDATEDDAKAWGDKLSAIASEIDVKREAYNTAFKDRSDYYGEVLSKHIKGYGKPVLKRPKVTRGNRMALVKALYDKSTLGHADSDFLGRG